MRIKVNMRREEEEEVNDNWIGGLLAVAAFTLAIIYVPRYVTKREGKK